ncbi:MAG TPA: stage V sporulation protein AD [Clostridiales bacterium]|nr:MAG: stage V sporulation protein AD [Clostridiales bacterium GWD2_32_19]HCC07375.1 stage V sporulation protein AD [Clostridiales bacterium]
MNKHLGKQTIRFDNPPVILASSSIVGPREGEGPLATYFDTIIEDELYGESTWEKAESKLIEKALEKVIEKANKTIDDVKYIISGDLLNQLTASTFGIRNFKVPFIGVYGACSTMAESLSVAAIIVEGGFADYVIASTSSHFCCAEKQFRSPLELGGQRPLTSTWTVTGSGAIFLAESGEGPKITYITTGKIVDFNIKDAMNMGAVMAPAAADTIINHFIDTERDENYYDLIVTGDLGKVGKELLLDILKQYNYDITSKYMDCGIEIFEADKQDTHSGGSGCGCGAVTLAGYILSEMGKGKWKKVLFVATGAMLSQVSLQQGESIPGIAHAVAIEN